MWWRPRTPWVLGSDKRINISFDEWNVWYLRELQADGMPREWTVAPRLSEDAYTVLDAVVVGSLLITLLRRSDRVHSACLAQLVNTISAIRTEPGGPAWRQSIFHPFALTAANARGDVLDPVVTAPTYETSSFGDVPVVDVAATHDAGTGRLAVFVVNRSPSEATELSLDVQGLEVIGLLSSALLADEDRSARNTADQPDRVRPRAHGDVALDGGRLMAGLPPASWSMFVLQVGS